MADSDLSYRELMVRAEKQAKEYQKAEAKKQTSDRLNKLQTQSTDFISKFGTKEYKRQLNYLTTRKTLDDYDIDTDQIAPNFRYYEKLVTQGNDFKQKFGQKRYEQEYTNLTTALKDDFDYLDKAIDVKKKGGYSSSVLEASPELKKLFVYDETDPEDLLKQQFGLAPKSFDNKAAKKIVDLAREAEATQKQSDRAEQKAEYEKIRDSLPEDEWENSPEYAQYMQILQDEMSEQDKKTTAPWYEQITEDGQVTEEELIKSINILNNAYNAQKLREGVQSGAIKGSAETGGEIPQPEVIQDTPIIQGTSASRGGTPQQVVTDRPTTAVAPTQEQPMEFTGTEAVDDAILAKEKIRNDFKAEVERLSGMPFADAMKEYQKYKSGWKKDERKARAEDEYTKKYREKMGIKVGEAFQPVVDFIDNATPEQLEPTREDTLNYVGDPTAAIAGGFGTGLIPFSDELAKIDIYGNKDAVMTKDEWKELVKKGAGKNYDKLREKLPPDLYPVSVNENGEILYRRLTTEEKLQIAQQKNPTAFGVSNAAGNIASTLMLGGGAAAGAKAAGAGVKAARAIGGFVPGAIRGAENSLPSGDAGTIIANTLGGGLIGAAGQGLVSPALEGLAGNIVNPVVRNIIGNAAGSIGYSGVDILGRTAIAAATGQKIDWGQELANIPADIVLDVLLGGKIDVPKAKAKQIIDANISDGVLNVDGVSKAVQADTPDVLKSVPTQAKPSKAQEVLSAIPGMKQGQTKTSSVAQSAYAATGDKVLKKNIDMGLYDFVSRGAEADYEAALKTAEPNKVVSKYENPIESVTAEGKTKLFERRYNDKDVAEITAALTKAYETGDVDAQQKLMAIAMDMGVTTGRSVNMWKMLKKLNSTGYTVYINRRIAKLNAEGAKTYKGKWNDVSLKQSEIDMIRDGKNQADWKNAEKTIAKRIANEMPSTLTEKDAAWRRIAMLLNPTTHVRNVVGNTFMSGMIEVRDKIMSVAELAVKKENRTKAFVVKKDTMNKAKQYYDDANVADEMQGVKYEVGRMQVMNQQKRVFKNKALNALDSATLKALSAEDNLFKKGRYIKSLARIMEARGLKEVTPEVHQYAMQDALEATFQDRSVVAEAIQRLKKTKGGVAVDIVVPFVKTPINITKRAIEYSPFGLGKAGVDFVKAGKSNAELTKINKQLAVENLPDADLKKLTGQKADIEKEISENVQKGIKDLAQGMTGTGVFALGLALASGQLIPGVSITGMAPSSNKEEDFLRGTGWQPLALKVGDNYISIDWLLPAGPVLLAGAQAYHEIEQGQPDIANIGIQGIFALSDSITNSSMLQSFKRVLNGDKSEDIALSMASDFLGQHVPTIGGKINAITEPNQVSSYSKNPLQNVKNRAIMAIPGMRQLLEQSGQGEALALPKETTDTWGQPISSGDVGTRMLNSLVNPAKVTKEQDSKVNKEIKRLYGVSQDTDVFPTDAVNITVTDVKNFYKESGTNLSTESAESIIKKLGEISERDAADMKQQFRKNSQAMLASLISMPNYSMMTDKEKVAAINKLYNAMRENIKNKFIRSKMVNE